MNALWKKTEFWKTIWKLVSLVQIWKLLTPLIIFFILKYFESWYSILAFLDLIVWSFVFLIISRFKEIDDSYIRKASWFKNSLKLHLDTIYDSFLFMKSSKIIVVFLISMIFWTDLYFLAKVILPVIVDSGIEDYISSIVVWLATLSWILWSMSSSKIAWKIWWKNSFSLFVFLNMLFHFLAFCFFDNKFLLTVLFIIITYIEFCYIPVRNHILMDLTPVRAKATIRSLFISVLLLYQFVFLFVLSLLEIKLWLLIIWLFMIISIIMSRDIVLLNNQK